MTDQGKTSLEKAHKSLIKDLPKQVRKKERAFTFKKKQLDLRITIVKTLRLITLLTSFASFVLAFRYPQYASILIPSALIGMVFLLWFENLWIQNMKEQIKAAKRAADPQLTSRALKFLKRPQNLAHLAVLFEKPSEESAYQRRILELIIDLAIACELMEENVDHIEATKDLMNDVLEEAYSAQAINYDPDFLKDWKKTYEKILQNLPQYFGKNLDTFCKKAEKDSIYFLHCLKKFEQSKEYTALKQLILKV